MRRIFSGRTVAAALMVGWAWIIIPGPLPSFAAPRESCVSATCHPDLGQEKFVHGPVATGDCLICHTQVKKHKFTIPADIGKLCAECHEGLDTEGVVHQPVKDGECTECHNPHQSPNRFMLREAGADLCFRCHDKSITGSKFVHGPVAVGSCSTCHHVHQSKFPKLLLADGNNVCFACHPDKMEDLEKKKFAHSPAKGSCMQCHSPHGGPFEYNLRLAGEQDLCLQCHTTKAREVQESQVKHGGLDSPKKCLKCHDPHVSDFARLLTMEPADLCLSCHDREYTKGSRKVADMKALLGENAIHHGPVEEKDCSSCHNAHGSDNFRILRRPFPDAFYARYNPENYQLCFMCHEQNLAAEERTSTMTGFRNGDQNLHFTHVNKSVKGRTCRACHDAHATNNPRHIRNAVPFGTWKLPVGFTKTATGGRCLPGCHQELGYDRDKPVATR